MEFLEEGVVFGGFVFEDFFFVEDVCEFVLIFWVWV